MKKLLFVLFAVLLLAGCDETGGVYEDSQKQKEASSTLLANQPTPTDIEYSLERYNLIKRAYWVNGMRDKANSLVAPIADMPLGYVILFTESGDVIGQFTVDGKVTSLNSFLTPDTTSPNREGAQWFADVDGSFGENDAGIFFFTTDGKYIEWDSHYLYSDIPFNVKDTILEEVE